MSIVRVGMGENPKYAEGYAAIFGTKTKKAAEKPAEKKAPAAKAKKPAKKKA